MQDTSRRPSEADEDDWSQIANQTMRKRVQNRLAQRKHRSGIKARLAELERLAAQKDGPSQGMQQSMADTNLDAAMQSAGFPSNDNRNNNNTNSTNPLHLNRHIPSNSNSNSSYPAVTVSGGQGLNSGPVLPVLRDVPFGTNFSVPDHGDDGGLSPIFLEGYAHGADGIAQYLEQRRDAPDFHQHLQSFGGGVDHNVHADCVAASGNQLNLDSLTAHSLCSHGSSKCSRNPSLMGTASNSSTTSPSSRPSTNSTDFHPSQNSSTRRGTTKNQRHNSNASTARTVDSLSMDDDGSPETSAALSTRIAAAIKSIRLLGFSGIEELTAQFYTADLNDLPALADAQRASRRRELARMLSQIRENANDGWSDWETHGYREEIVHAAEEILSDECRRFLEEHENATGGKGAKSRQQLKRQFQDELPNLYGVLGVLCSSSKDWEETDHSAVIVNAINSILSGSARS